MKHVSREAEKGGEKGLRPSARKHWPKAEDENARQKAAMDPVGNKPIERGVGEQGSISFGLHWKVRLEFSLMSSAAAPVHHQQLPSPALRRFAWGVLAYFVAVILWGSLVRATGSGAGCGDHWPLCNGSVLQHSPRVDTIIEFTHRITSGLSFFSAVGLLVWTFLGTARGHLARAASVAAVAFTLVEAILGAFIVKLGLTAQSQSPLRAPYLALHLTNTLLLLAALTLTAHLLDRLYGYTSKTVRLEAPIGAIAAILMVLVVGVTGSLAALGDTLFPATSLGAALTQDFSATSGWLVRWRWTHPTIALFASVFLIWLLLRARKRTAHWDNRGLSALVLVLLAAQYVLGFLDVVMLAPTWLQIAHLLGADVLWAALVVLTARVMLEPVKAGNRV
jgi:cytochrome c oxidase assembly protein subunit 15